jgi:hypothetical protein
MTEPAAKSGLAHIFKTENNTDIEREDEPHFELERAPSWFHNRDSMVTGDTSKDRYTARNPDRPLVVETPGPEEYEDFKRKLDDRFSQAQRLFDNPPKPTVQRPTLPLDDIHGRRRLYKQEQAAQIADVQKARPAGASITKMLGLGVIALLVGGGAGLGVLNHELVASKLNSGLETVHTSLAEFSLPQLNDAPTAHETIIPRKSVSIASLEVNDVRGTLNSMIPLALSAQSAEGEELLSLKVMGLPTDSYLTKGVEISKGNWLLKPADIAGVQLVVPQTDAPQFNVEVAAIEEKSGVLAAPVKAMTVEIDKPVVQTAEAPALSGTVNLAATIAPANSPPESAVQQPSGAAPQVVNPEAVDFIAKGDGLLNSGDLASARQFYMRADELGDAHGAYGVGRTYDPSVFAELNVQGLLPDPEKAKQWYKKAAVGGVAAAKTALETLLAAK